MIFEDIVTSAQKIDSRGASIPRATFFNGIGVNDPYSMNPLTSMVDVSSGRELSIYNQVKKSVGAEISHRNILRQFAGVEVNNRMKELDQLEAFGWVEKHCNKDGRISYRIIFLAKKLCGARFTLCKELMHIHTQTVDGADGGAEAMLKCAFKWRENIKGESAELDEETVGFYHAIESMLPWSLREQFDSMRNDLGTNTKEDRDMKIAQAFMIPAKVISHVCDDDCEIPYYGFSYRINVRVSNALNKQ